MRLTVGSKVIYPSQGPCRIGPVVQKIVAGSPISFYRLMLLDESGGELFVPVDKVQASGLRLPLKRSEIPKLLGQLKQPVSAAKDWKQRAKDNLTRFASGSAFDLAEIVESLTARSETKELSFQERRTLEKARKLLVCEIAEVMRKTKSAAEEQVDQALKARKITGVGG
jgi:CarD family transcriptional regulator